ncbi:MAG: sodium:proton antiporter [Spirochaetia bacterium]|nr:sodium:proton antiporter [Spirochaetia bacterium]
MTLLRKSLPYLTAIIFIPWLALFATDQFSFNNKTELAAPVLFLILFAVLPLFLWKLELNFRMVLLPLLFVIVLILLFIFQKDYFFRTGKEYLLFIAVLPVYYIIGEAIAFDLIFVGNPATNTFYLAAGALISNFIGGPAASLLLIRPFLNANRYRKHSTHTVIFFIIIVANASAFLSPISNTHLYIAYLKGFSPEHFLKFIPIWLAIVGILLFLFYLIDSIFLWKEPRQNHPAKQLAEALYLSLKKEELKQSLILKTIQYLQKPTLQISGAYNVWLLPIILLILIFTSQLKSEIPYRELSLIILGIYSFIVTPVIHFKKRVIIRLLDLMFLYFFAFFVVGFIARMFIDEYPFYLDTIHKAWLISTLSGFIDNVSASVIIFNPEFLSRSVLEQSNFFSELIFSEKKFKNITALLIGISIMGGLTYLGNYVNIFIKDEAEKSGIKMPNFFMYMIYSIPVMIIVSAVTIIFISYIE